MPEPPAAGRRRDPAAGPRGPGLRPRPGPAARASPGSAARVAAYLAALLAAGLAVSTLPAGIGGDALQRALAAGDGERAAPYLLAGAALVALAFLFVTHLFLRHIERRPWSLLLPPGAGARRFAAGALAGAGMLALLAALLAAAGVLRFSGGAGREAGAVPALLGWGAATLAIVLLQSGAEEVACRGYLLHALARWRGAAAALVGSSVIFGLLHGLNPGVTPAALANTALVGLLLGLIRLRGTLWAAIGFHAAWNFLMGFVLAQPVSGVRWPGLLATAAEGSPALTGGEFGLEASLPLAALIALAIAGLLIRPGHARALARLEAESRGEECGPGTS